LIHELLVEHPAASLAEAFCFDEQFFGYSHKATSYGYACQ
jgi:hypothetical protein